MPTNDFMGNGHTRAKNSPTHNGETPPNAGTEPPQPSTEGQNLESLAVTTGQRLNHSWWAMRGSRAQLEAEGVIPKGVIWPQGRAQRLWINDGRHYRLCRTRPEGLKGPMRLWANADHWEFTCTWYGAKSLDAWRLEEKRKALADELRRQSHEGRIERHCLDVRLREADQDAAFQALKAKLMPAKAAKKTGGAA